MHNQITSIKGVYDTAFIVYHKQHWIRLWTSPCRNWSLPHYSLHRHRLVKTMFLKFNTDNETYHFLLPLSEFFHLHVWFFRKDFKSCWCSNLFWFLRTKLQCMMPRYTEYNINNDCSGVFGLFTVYPCVVQSALIIETLSFCFLT